MQKTIQNIKNVVTTNGSAAAWTLTQHSVRFSCIVGF